MTGYDYSRQWFDFAFENTGKVTGNHGCLYLWFVELNNRLGWVKEFYAPTNQGMVACGIASYTTFSKIFKDLVDWGFVKIIKKSINQFQSSLIALPKNVKATVKALDKALVNHLTEQLPKQLLKQVEYNKTTNHKPQTTNKESPTPFEKISQTAEILETEKPDAKKIAESLRAEIPKKEKKIRAASVDVKWPWDEPEFLELWEHYEQHRIEHPKGGKPYASRGRQAALTELYNMAQGDMRTAIDILRCTFFKSWLGFEYVDAETLQLYRNHKNGLNKNQNGHKNGTPRYTREGTLAAAREAAGDNS